MEMILISLLTSLITGGMFGGYAAYTQLEELDKIFFVEREFSNLSILGIDLLFSVFLGYGISLIVLKFLKKGFDIYILGVEGDAELDPIVHLTNFFRAMGVAIGFPVIYEWIVEVFNEVLSSTFKIIGLQTGLDPSTLISDIGTSLFNAVLFFIFFIIYMILQFRFHMIGLELFILRVGLPLASCGLMDADKGVFRPYMQKFIQSFFTVLIQITLSRFGLALMINKHVLWGIATLWLAIKTPRFLQEFLITSSGSGISGVYHSLRMIQMARASFRPR